MQILDSWSNQFTQKKERIKKSQFSTFAVFFFFFHLLSIKEIMNDFQQSSKCKLNSERENLGEKRNVLGGGVINKIVNWSSFVIFLHQNPILTAVVLLSCSFLTRIGGIFSMGSACRLTKARTHRSISFIFFYSSSASQVNQCKCQYIDLFQCNFLFVANHSLSFFFFL